MAYRFGRFELDTLKGELRTGGVALRIEPQVFAVLALLVANRERLVSKDELIEKVWDGRVVSESAVSSRIKTARQLLGDDGTTQQFIKTVHRRGFRFVADATVHSVETPRRAEWLPLAQDADARPSIAVLPFRLVGTARRYAEFAEGIPDELISELSRSRWLFVTARGSSFRIRDPNVDMVEAGRTLGVRYCLSGSVEVLRSRLIVEARLADTRDGGVIWADRFSGAVDNVHVIRADLRSRALTALELRISLHEATLARQQVTENLDAWSAYHLGLQHVYRFNRADNESAAMLFEQAIRQDPGFARAHAGLSFVHFQLAFMQYVNDRTGAIREARRYAERGVELDPLDPFINFNMARTFWLDGELETSLAWLERAISLSPNFAQGIYARAWSECMAGRGLSGRRDVDHAMRLSPIDPLFYAMLATRALSHMIDGEQEAAADWAERAARSPGAHALIALIAVAMHAIAGNDSSAASWAANVRARRPDLNVTSFFDAFPMQSEAAKRQVSRALEGFGF